jgi:AcrR family transcriptional regulator
MGVIMGRATARATDASTSTGTGERRARLDQETVVAAAEQLVDTHGYDALTMTSLAGALDTRVSSLYNHVANLEDLRSVIQIRAMRLLGREVRTAAMGRTGADGIRALSSAFRDFAQRYPQRYAAMTRTPIDREAYFDATADAAEAIAVMVRSAGVPEDRLLQTQLALFAALHGYVSLEVTGFFGNLDVLEAVFAQVIRGAITAAVLEATEPAG